MLMYLLVNLLWKIREPQSKSFSFLIKSMFKSSELKFGCFELISKSFELKFSTFEQKYEGDCRLFYKVLQTFWFFRFSRW